MSKNSQNFRSSSVQPNEKKENTNKNRYNSTKFGYRNNISSYSLNQSQQSLFLGINEGNDHSFHSSAILNYQDHNLSNNILSKSPQIYINSNLALFNENQKPNSLRPQNFNKLNTNENYNSLNHLIIGKNPKLIETSSLRSFNSSFSDSSSLLSLNVALNHDSNDKDDSKLEKNNDSHIAENYLLLERLNQRQRQKQLLQSKKDLHRQQLNDLKHKHLNLEQKFVQPRNRALNSDVFNSKLASHYSLNSNSNLSNSSYDRDKSHLNFSTISSNQNERIYPSNENKFLLETNIKANFQKSKTFSNETLFIPSGQEKFPINKSTDLFMLKKSINEKNSLKKVSQSLQIIFLDLINVLKNCLKLHG